MTVLAAIQYACSVIGIDPIPSQVFGSTEREHVEIAALSNEIAKRLAASHDWQRLKTVATITGDGASEEFALPSLYMRMIKKAHLWSPTLLGTSLVHQPDSDAWLQEVTNDTLFAYPRWTIYGDKIHVRPILGAGEIVRFFYISNNITADGKVSFSSDADSFLLDERLLGLGIIWQWKANKGLPYAEDLANYNDAYNYITGADKGSNLLVVGSPRSRVGADYAFPAVIIP